jgi:hypothetical protein
MEAKDQLLLYIAGKGRTRKIRVIKAIKLGYMLL